MYTNKENESEGFVLAKETNVVYGIQLDYVCEFIKHEGEFHIQWTPNLELAQTFSYMPNVDKSEYVKEIIEHFGFNGEIDGYHIKEILKVGEKLSA